METSVTPTIMSIWIGTIIIAFMTTAGVFGCPSEVCTCKWKGGKQTVECNGNYLSALPDGMDPGTQVLNFTGNGLQVLKSERFLKMDLINLQKIFLSRNQLIRINDKAFKGLSNLVELDLSENMLTTVPSETFQDYSSLMRLTLSGNPIRELKTNGFRHLPFLTTLELSNCQIERIEDEAFLGMDNLEWLRLDGNRIGTIQGNHILPKSLHGINMHGNRWNCDCNMVDLHAWLINYNIPQQVEDPKCIYPARLNGEVIKFLRAEELACLPAITPTTWYIELTEGRNISLPCKITSIPEATVSWWFQGQMLQNDSFFEPNLHMYYFVEEGAEDKRSELFIYNTKVEHNGTFTCVAENYAGKTQANYTIRVILKEEPITEEVIFPYEYMILLLFAAGATGFVFVAIVCCMVLKCLRRSKRSRRRKESSKDSTIQLQNSKCSSILSEHVPIPILKANGAAMMRSTSQQDMMYATQHQMISNQDMMIPTAESGEYRSPSSNRNFHEANPDLINDAESNKCRQMLPPHNSDDRSSNGSSSLQGSYENGYHPMQKMLGREGDEAPRFNPLATIPRSIMKDMYQPDLHLSPTCFLGQQDGFAVQYQMHQQSGISVMPRYSYMTLPHKPKQQVSAMPRYPMEAEYLLQPGTSSQDPNRFRDKRYMAPQHGYPTPQKQVAFLDQQYPSPPEGYKCDVASSPCQNNQAVAYLQWPPCLPGYHQSQMMPMHPHSVNFSPTCLSPTPSTTSSVSTTTQTHPAKNVGTNPTTKRSAGVQSQNGNHTIHEHVDENDEEAEGLESTGNEHQFLNGHVIKHLTRPLADSPDEGYVGDSQDGSDM